MPARFDSVFVETEATPGTAETMVAADVIHFDAENTSISEGGNQPIRRRTTSPWLDRYAPVKPAGQFWNLSIQTEVKATADVDDPQELEDLWTACGLLGTQNAATNYTYSMVDNPNASASQASATVRFEEDGGNVYTAAGCNFDFELAFANDSPLMATFNGMGKYATPAANASALDPADSDYLQFEPFVVLDAAANNPFQFHSYDMIIRSGSIRWGVTIETRPHMASDTTNNFGWPGIITRGQDSHVNGEFEIELVSETAFGHWAAYEAATAAAGQIIFLAGARTLTINLRDVVFDAPVPSGTDLRLVTVAWTASRTSAGLDAFDMVFT